MVFFLFLLVGVGVVGVLWRRRYLRRQRQMALQKLRRWVGDNTTLDPELQRWVQGLSAGEATVLFDLLNGYCTSLNWELAWLFDTELEKVPLLKQALEEGVVTYACSILASLQLVEDVRIYKAYLALTQKPTGRKQFVLIQKLYKTLEQHGALDANKIKPPWWRRQPTRRQQITAVITAFDQQPVLAIALLRTLLIDEALSNVQQVVDMMPLPRGTVPMGAAA
jgi:hypothetical protein